MDFMNSERKARKPHRCYMCGCEIEVGQKYIRQFTPEYRTAICMHKECEKLLSHEGFCDEESCEGTSDDFFGNAIFDYVNMYHTSSDGKALDEGWDGDNYHLVKMILKELEDLV
jgi:hypothetical protein